MWVTAPRAAAAAGPTQVAEDPTCLLCESSRFRRVYDRCGDLLLGRPGSFAVLECNSCGLGRTHPQPGPEEILGYYEEAYYDAAPAATGPGSAVRAGLRWARDAPFRLRYGPPALPAVAGGRLLEVGCGNGTVMSLLRAQGWEVWGIEPDAQAAETARRHLALSPQRVQVARAEEAAIPEGSFDAVVLHHVVEHLHDPAGVLAKARAGLRPHGRLLIACPNFASLERRLFGRYWLGLDIPRHLHHFTPATLAQLAREAGFRLQALRPQPEYVTPAGSVWLAAHALTGRNPPGRREPRGLYLALLPLVAAGRALGLTSCIELVARPA
jgi:2-polyprenyl-3-methyl-5-hydroxy-6-metoxy-1,4-benzoquinol methylase